MMKPTQWTLLVTVAAAALVVPVLSTDYCSLSCVRWNNNGRITYNHTMCSYPTAGLADSCPKLSDSDTISKVTADQQKAILDAHNTIRNDIKNGAYASNGLPAAAAMPALQWDDELATVAQRWADQCQIAHDKCRRVPRYWVGQNAAWMWTSAGSPNWAEHAVNRWFFSELDNFKQGTLKFTSGRDAVSGKVIGHLTQVVWAKTTHVGCGFTKTDSTHQGLARFSYFCNYGPAGNFLNQNIYEV